MHPLPSPEEPPFLPRERDTTKSGPSQHDRRQDRTHQWRTVWVRKDRSSALWTLNT